jgi:hypothetical protein
MNRSYGPATVVVAQLVMATRAHAQAMPQAEAERCVAVSASQVVVELRDGSRTRGTLLCLGQAEAATIGHGVVTRYPIAQVRRITRPPDPVYDGALKGAAFGALVLLFCGGGCESGYVLRSMAGYALIGATIDSFDTHADVLYRHRASHPALGWRVRF